MGRETDAVRDLEIASRNSPNSFAVWGNLGDAYRRTKANEKADAAYQRSIALARERLSVNPSDTDALGVLATSLAKTGRTAEAADPIRRSLDAAKDQDPVVLSDAATVAALAGRDEEALRFLRRSAALGYCADIFARQPEYERLREKPEFRSIIAAPQKATRS